MQGKKEKDEDWIIERCSITAYRAFTCHLGEDVEQQPLRE